MNKLLHSSGFYFVLIVSNCLFFQCSKGKELPIERTTLVPLLADIHLAEAAVQPLNKELKDSMLHIYYQQIFQIHRIDSNDFQTTLAMLREEPKSMSSIYAEVFEFLEKEDRETN